VGKKEALANLILLRKKDRNPKYCALSEFEGGFYDTDGIDPWTISACNLDADLMIVGQDWCSADSLSKSDPAQRELRRHYGRDANFPTNKRLQELLKKHCELEIADTYATNVFVFIKPGGISAPISMKDLAYCAEKEVEVAIIKMIDEAK
jgi:restriction system protein